MLRNPLTVLARSIFANAVKGRVRSAAAVNPLDGSAAAPEEEANDPQYKRDQDQKPDQVDQVARRVEHQPHDEEHCSQYQKRMNHVPVTSTVNRTVSVSVYQEALIAEVVSGRDPDDWQRQ